MSGQRGFWDFEDRLCELSAQGDALEKLASTVDFEMFRPDLAKATARRDPSKLPSGLTALPGFASEG